MTFANTTTPLDHLDPGVLLCSQTSAVPGDLTFPIIDAEHAPRL